jgi:Domain of unknown function (DUF1707)
MTDEPGQHDPSGEVRASDAEREAAVERLRVATVEGRLTMSELTERTEAAYTATTRGELASITADLPAAPGSSTAPVRPDRPAGREWVVAVMGDTRRQGRWRVDGPLAATAVMGDVKVYVPDGVDVQLSGIAVMGDKKIKVREAPPGRTAPKVTVRATVVMGDVKIVGDSYAEPIRRALRGWITRDDRDRRAIE